MQLAPWLVYLVLYVYGGIYPRAAYLFVTSLNIDETLTKQGAGRNVVEVLKERGLVDAITSEEGLRKAAAEGTLRVYCGFDPTADSLHLVRAHGC